MRLSTWDAGTYSFVFQSFSKPIRVVTANPELPLDLWQSVEERGSAPVVADLAGGDEEAERASFASVLGPMAHDGSSVTEGMELCVHSALGAANHAFSSRFLTRRLDAVRCAFR